MRAIADARKELGLSAASASCAAFADAAFASAAAAPGASIAHLSSISFVRNRAFLSCVVVERVAPSFNILPSTFAVVIFAWTAA